MKEKLSGTVLISESLGIENANIFNTKDFNIKQEKMTAVEWLIEQMKNGNFESWHTKNKWNISYHAQEKTLEIAKAMEKEQIINACEQFSHYPFDIIDYYQYYNETYNK